MGVLEEGAKAAGGVVEAMKGSPMQLANILLQIAFLVFIFYYVSRIASRTETSLQLLFAANDKIFAQWTGVIKDTNALTEKAMHCILPEDALKLMQAPTRSPIEAPRAPVRPQSDERAEDGYVWPPSPITVPLPQPRPPDVPASTEDHQ